MDFVDKKEEFANMLESFAKEELSKEDLLTKVNQLKEDEDINNISLFENIFEEILNSIDDLSNKEIKQRALLIRSYIE